MLPHVGKLLDYAPFWKETGPSAPHVGEKIACEFAWLLLLTRRLSFDGDIERACEHLVGQLAAYLRSPEHLRISMQNPQFASSFAIAHRMLTDAGYPDAVWDRVIRAGLLPERFDIKERYPHRILERLWVLELYNIPATLAVAEVAALSILAGDADPLTMTDSDAYAYTHAIFYLTDFGRTPLPPSLDTARLRAVVDSAVAWQIGQRNYDLLGEFLVCAALLGGAPSSHAALGLALWNGTWNELGFLPGPSFNADVFEPLEGDAQRAYAFAELYHTNLVGGLLALVALHGAAAVVDEPDAPTPSQASEQASEAVIGAVLDALDGSRPTSRTDGWADLIKAAVGVRTDGLGPLLDALTIVAIRAGDFATLAQALTLRADLGVPASWIIGRTAGYLQRFRLAEPERLAPVLSPSELAALAKAEIAMQRVWIRDGTSKS
jgi:hypothetical protein